MLLQLADQGDLITFLRLHQAAVASSPISAAILKTAVKLVIAVTAIEHARMSLHQRFLPVGSHETSAVQAKVTAGKATLTATCASQITAG